MRTCAKTGCFRDADDESFYCRFHNNLDIAKLFLGLLAVISLLYFMTACAFIPHTHTTVECFRGDVKSLYSSSYEAKNGCGVKIEKNGLLDEPAARAIKIILDSAEPPAPKDQPSNDGLILKGAEGSVKLNRFDTLK